MDFFSKFLIFFKTNSIGFKFWFTHLKWRSGSRRPVQSTSVLQLRGLSGKRQRPIFRHEGVWCGNWSCHFRRKIFTFHQVFPLQKADMCEREFTCHAGPVFQSHFHPLDKQLFATCGRDKCIKVWNLAENRGPLLESTISTIAPMGSIAWMPSRSNYIASTALVTDFSISVRHRLIDWLIDRLIVRLSECSIDWLIGEYPLYKLYFSSRFGTWKDRTFHSPPSKSTLI